MKIPRRAFNKILAFVLPKSLGQPSQNIQILNSKEIHQAENILNPTTAAKQFSQAYKLINQVFNFKQSCLLKSGMLDLDKATGIRFIDLLDKKRREKKITEEDEAKINAASDLCLQLYSWLRNPENLRTVILSELNKCIDELNLDIKDLEQSNHSQTDTNIQRNPGVAEENIREMEEKKDSASQAQLGDLLRHSYSNILTSKWCDDNKERDYQEFLRKFIFKLAEIPEDKISKEKVRQQLMAFMSKQISRSLWGQFQCHGKDPELLKPFSEEERLENSQEKERKTLLNQIASQILNPGQELASALEVLSEDNHKQEDRKNLTVSPPVLKHPFDT